MDIEKIPISETHFRYEMNKSKMATDLLSAGIRKFEEDGNKLKEMIRERLNAEKKDEWFWIRQIYHHLNRNQDLP